MQKGFVAEVLDSWLELPLEQNVFGPRARDDKLARLPQKLVDINGLAGQMQLSGIRHGEGEQPFNDSGKLSKLAVKNLHRCSVFGGGSLSGKKQFGFAMKHGKRGAHFMGSIGNELAQLLEGRIYALQKMIDCLRESTQLIARRRNRQRRPKPFVIGYAFRHQFGVPSKFCYWCQTFSDINRRDHRGQD